MANGAGLHYIQLWVADLLKHVWREGESMELLGMRVMLWAISAEEDPVGTLPDDPEQWARWCGCSADAMRALSERLTASWKQDASGRWVIRRIVEQNNRSLDRSRSAKAAARASVAMRKARSATVERPLSERSANVEHPLSPLNSSSSSSSSSTPDQEQKQRNIPKQVRDAFAIGLRLKDAAGGRSAAYKLTDHRRKKIAARIRELEALKKSEGWKLDTLEVIEGVLERFYASAWHRERGLTDFCKSVFHSWENFERWLNDAYEPSKRASSSAGESVGDDRQGHGQVLRAASDGRILTLEEAEQAAAEQERYPAWDPRCGYRSGRSDRAANEMDFG